MIKKLLIIILGGLSITLNGQNLIFEWAISMGSTTSDHGTSITADINRNIYTTGVFSGTVDFDPGPNNLYITSVSNTYDIFIQKLNPNGNLLWAISIGGVNNIIAKSITTDINGNIYTTGVFSGTVDFDPGPNTYNLTSNFTYTGNCNAWSYCNDFFVIKLDSIGNLIWAKSMGTTDLGEMVSSISTDTNGNVYTTGFFKGTVDFDPGPGTLNLTSFGQYDTFIQKLDSSGNLVWAKSMGGVDDDRGMSITNDFSGNVYTTGNFVGTVDFDPGPGTLNLISVSNNKDIFIQKLDPNGNLIWAEQIGGGNYDKGYSITTDNSGNVFTTGYFKGTVDFDPGPNNLYITSVSNTYDIFIQKLDPNSNLVWAKSIGGTVDEQSLSITCDPSDNVYTTGYFEGTVDFDPGLDTFNLTSVGNSDIFIQKLDLNGNLVCAKSMGGTNDSRGTSITIDTSGNVYTIGWFKGTADFNPGTGYYNLTSAGDMDIFIQKFKPCLNSYQTDFQTACYSYTWLDSVTYTSSNFSATHTLTNAAGCDSIITLNLTINNSSTGTDTQTACYSYTWIDGNTYTSSNYTATHTLANATGCDSVVTLNLTINTANSSVTQNGIYLSANQTGASYQWLECPPMTPISGATSQTYTATVNGDYAVIVTHNGCVDTSACFTVNTVGIIQNNFGNEFIFYPNPSDGDFTIDLGNIYESIAIKLTDLNGKLIETNYYNNTQFLHLKIEEPVGIYLLNIETEAKKAIIKLMKE